MQLEILGASGGIETNSFTSSYLINSSILFDAGTGLGRLSLEEQAKIKKIFLTHAHMDHICSLPLILDGLFESLTQPLEVYALPEVISRLQANVFNWEVWPDFTQLDNGKCQILKFFPLEPNQEYRVETYEGEIKITPFLAPHTVPACSFLITNSAGKKLVYTGDTTYTADYVAALNSLGKLDALLIECAFPTRMKEVVLNSKHLCPKMLKLLVSDLTRQPEQLLVTHFKPSQAAEIAQELDQELADVTSQISYVKAGEVYNF